MTKRLGGEDLRAALCRHGLEELVPAALAGGLYVGADVRGADRQFGHEHNIVEREDGALIGPPDESSWHYVERLVITTPYRDAP